MFTEVVVKIRGLRITLLTLIFIAGFVLRLWGNTFGLPHRYAPDEGMKVKVALTYKEKGYRHSYSQPSSLYNSLYLLSQAAKVTRPLLEGRTRLQRLPLLRYEPKAYLLWVGRCWMALLGAITVLLVYLLGRKIGDEKAGVFAAALYAFCPLPVISAHYIKEDTPLVLWVTLSTVLCISLIERGRKSDYLYAGLASGAAFGAKYSGGMAFILLIIAHLLRENTDNQLPDSGKGGQDRRAWLLFLSGISFLIGFAIISPNLLLRVSDLFKGVIYQSKYILRGHHGGITVGALENLFTFYLRNALFPGITIPVMIGALVGIWRLWEEKRAVATLMLAWIVGYYLFAESSPSKPYPFYSRYILPIVPHLCALAGVFGSAVLSRKSALWKKWPIRLASVALVPLMLLLPVYLSIRYVSTMIPDTRDVAGQWIDANIPKGSILIVSSGLFSYGAPIDHKAYREVKLSDEAYEEYKAYRGAQEVLLIVNGFLYERFLENPEDVPEKTKMYREIFTRERLLKEFKPPFKPYGFNNPVIRIYAFNRES
ncbi:MAG TPA: glycosyltransferase family 39 protein [Candidatus Methylomirabilis sp.]